MTLPALPPDLTFTPLGNAADDIDFAFQAKRAAIGPHIIARWGWDEAFQRNLHERRYSEKPFFAIQRANQRLGTISFAVLSTYIRIGEFYLFPRFHRQGIGTTILKHCIKLADDQKLPIRLEYLHWNPVGSLYRRWGFVEKGKSDTHYFMERPPSLP